MRLIILCTTVFLMSTMITTSAYGKDYDDFVVHFLLNDDDCPLQVVDWNAWYRAKDTITFGDAFIASYTDTAPRVRDAGFQYDLRIRNDGNSDIIAWQVNAVVFSAFEEYLDTFGIFHGAVMSPEKDITRKNRAMFNGDNQFMTFFIWVDKARDADGNLYFADLSDIQSKIEKEMGFTISESYLEAGTVQEVNQQTRFRKRVFVDAYHRR